MSDGAGDSLLRFPCDLAVKVFGRNDTAFRDAVIAIVESHSGQAYAIAEHESKQAAYLSLTITVRAESREEIDAVYRDLVAHELVLMAL
jgi:putative lipoic acid-binding regulatory protein